MACFEGVPPKAIMRLSGLLFFYRQRLSEQAVPELFAGLGIAVAVALLFAVTVASQSIIDSASEVNGALVGPASLQLRARGPEGIDEHMLDRVEALGGVAHAAPLLEQNATIVTANGSSVAVNLAGTDISLAVLDGLVHTLPIATLEKGGVGLSKASATALGIPRIRAQSRSGPVVLLQLHGQATPLRVSAVLGSESFGALSQARVAVMPIERLQALDGLPHRITRILVQVKPGQEARVRAELTVLAAGRLTVAPANQDVSLLHEALKPAEQASLFFAAISALLGFLFTFNAVLLTVPARRQAIADLRLSGTTSSAIVQMVLFQALCLGVAATLVGLLVGYGLSVVFAQTPNYLAKGFTLGTSTSIGVAPLLVAGLGGIFATCVASMLPLLDLRRGRAVGSVYLEAGEPGNALGGRVALRLALTAVVLVVVRMMANSVWPSLALAWCALLAIAAVLCVPLLFAGVLNAGEVIAQRFQARLTLLPLALESLSETTLRSLALVATGAVALFGAVALGGARDDLVQGIGGFATHYSRGGDIWVVTPNDNQAVTAFSSDNRQRRIAGLPGVRDVEALSGGLIDVGNRRVWALAWPSHSRLELLDGQIIKGNLATAIVRLRQGGWATVSQQVAVEHGVGVGGTLALPTPTGAVRFKVAAETTNFGWSPGAIVINTADYARVWSTTQPTALVVQTMPEVNPQTVQREIERSLAPNNGLEVLTAQAREAKMTGSVREGLGQLATISRLLVLASILAMAAALASAVWQRRTSLAELRLSGVKPSRLRRLLLLESTLMLSIGAVTGAVWGIYGQTALDGYLRTTTGFPVRRLGESVRPLEVLALVIIASLTISVLPAWFTARVPARVALEE
jgi:putative ABC transport system permease protein